MLQKNRKTALKAVKRSVEGCNGLEKIHVEDSEIFMDIELDDCQIKPNNFKDGFEVNYEAQDIKEKTIQKLVLSPERHMASKIMHRGVRSFQKSNKNMDWLITSTVLRLEANRYVQNTPNILTIGEFIKMGMDWNQLLM